MVDSLEIKWPVLLVDIILESISHSLLHALQPHDSLQTWNLTTTILIKGIFAQLTWHAALSLHNQQLLVLFQLSLKAHVWENNGPFLAGECKGLIKAHSLLLHKVG